MRRFVLSWLLLPLAGASAQGVQIPGPDAGTRRFGDDLVLLPNGAYLVTDPEWSAGPNADAAGAVYHYSAEGKIVSRLTGSSAADRVGSGGVVVLANGDFVVHSPDWDGPGGKEDAGAVTWVDADVGIGLTTHVGADNSLVGSSAGDRVGSRRAVKLVNGNYVIVSGEWDRPGIAVNAGAVTWCAADGSTIGPVNSANSLVGSQAEDRVGEFVFSERVGVIALKNGDYAVASPNWDSGSIADAGAVTWAKGDGSTGTGVVTAANSLIGTHVSDLVGADVIALQRADGHYVVLSPEWDDGATANAGAVTWANGSQPTIGTVSALNSLTGSQPNDRVGSFAAVLTNGNYVVASPFWRNGSVEFAGAATWRDGSVPQPGVVSPANSLVGTSYGDQVGYFTALSVSPLGVVPLPNGDYLVASPEWNRDPDLLRTGALTWGDGDGGTQGAVGVGNSLVGARRDDRVAQYVRMLTNGNFVVASPLWSQRRGAATWGDGQGPLVGVVGPDNSLVGVNTSDFVTAYGIQALPDGGYAIRTPLWRRPSDDAPVGAVTRAPPGGGIVGAVSAENSFTGGELGDFAGSGGVIGLANGDLLVRSELASRLGGLSRIPAAASPATFAITAGNSLTGVEAEPLGSPGAARLSDGAVIFLNVTGPADGAITITLFAADDRFRGLIPAIDTVRSTVVDGVTKLTYAYLAAQATLLVGDPVGNRIVRLSRSQLFHDGFD
jgi:hypothetical protein